MDPSLLDMKKAPLFLAISVVILGAAWLLWPKQVDLVAAVKDTAVAIQTNRDSSVPLLIGEKECDADARRKALAALHEVAGDFEVVQVVPAYRFPTSQGVILKVRVDGQVYDLPQQGFLVNNHAAVEFERLLATCVGIRRRHRAEMANKESGSRYMAAQVSRFRPVLEQVPFRHLSIEGQSFNTWDEVVADIGRNPQ